MARLSTLFLLLSAAVAASAQEDKCTNQVSVTTEMDLAPVVGCTTFSGTLTVNGPGMNALVWPGLKSLTGTIKVSSSSRLTVLSLDNLQTCSGTMTLFNNTALTTITMASLKSMNALEIITAPSLRQLSLSSLESLTSLKIEDTALDNTGALPWSSLQKATDLGISNNKFLKEIEMPHLKAVSGRFVVAGNGLQEGQGKGCALHLSNLTTASNCTFRHLTDLKVPALASVSASLAFDETNLKIIYAPTLRTVGQTISIVSNNVLTNISFPELASIGGALFIANNTELKTVDGFKKLREIQGVLSVRGDLTNMTLPSVTSVLGGMSVLSSSKDFDCSALSKVKASARGKTLCQAMVKSARPSNNSNDGGDDSQVGNTGTTSRPQSMVILALIWALGYGILPLVLVE